VEVGIFVKLSHSMVISPDFGSSMDVITPRGETNCISVLFSKSSDNRTEFSVYLIPLKGMNAHVVSFWVTLWLGLYSTVLSDTPCGPCGPCGPVGPVEPGGPCGPVEPCGPCGPVEPVEPCGPVGPVEPGGPEGPTCMLFAIC